MRNNKKWITLATITALCFGVCAPVYADDEKVTLTIWGWDSGYVDALCGAYEELNPNVHFEFTPVEHGDDSG